MVQPGPRVVVVDDAAPFLELVRDALGLSGYDVVGYGAPDVSPDLLAGMRPDVAILDLRLRPELEQFSGLDLLRLIRADQRLREVPVIMCSADHGGLRAHAGAFAELPPTHVLAKPFELHQLDALIGAALDRGIAHA